MKDTKDIDVKACGSMGVTDEKVKELNFVIALFDSGMIRSKVNESTEDRTAKYKRKWVVCDKSMKNGVNSLCFSCAVKCYGCSEDFFEHDEVQERYPKNNEVELVLSSMNYRDWRVYGEGSHIVNGCCDCYYCECPLNGY